MDQVAINKCLEHLLLLTSLLSFLASLKISPVLANRCWQRETTSCHDHDHQQEVNRPWPYQFKILHNLQHHLLKDLSVYIHLSLHVYLWLCGSEKIIKVYGIQLFHNKKMKSLKVGILWLITCMSLNLKANFNSIFPVSHFFVCYLRSWFQYVFHRRSLSHVPEQNQGTGIKQ